MTDVSAERARLEALRSAPAPLTGAEAEGTARAAAQRATGRPPDQRPLAYTQRTLGRSNRGIARLERLVAIGLILLALGWLTVGLLVSWGLIGSRGP